MTRVQPVRRNHRPLNHTLLLENLKHLHLRSPRTPRRIMARVRFLKVHHTWGHWAVYLRANSIAISELTAEDAIQFPAHTVPQVKTESVIEKWISDAVTCAFSLIKCRVSCVRILLLCNKRTDRIRSSIAYAAILQRRSRSNIIGNMRWKRLRYYYSFTVHWLKWYQIFPRIHGLLISIQSLIISRLHWRWSSTIYL